MFNSLFVFGLKCEQFQFASEFSLGLYVYLSTAYARRSLNYLFINIGSHKYTSNDCHYVVRYTTWLHACKVNRPGLKATCTTT